jgi:DNA (cytosine-5)-methyltransferase 1
MLRIFEMFAGYGGASFALRKANIDFECVGFSEIDKYAIQCYQQNHCITIENDFLELVKKPKSYGDCTKINPLELPDFNLLTGGFPCQSFSVAGKMGGEADARGTLFYEIIRIAEAKKPKYMLLENVKGLTCAKFKDTFDKILSELDRIGYNIYWKVLNSKNFGIPQSRQRIWFVCIRKDIQMQFQFPEQEELKIFIKDILETEVDEKYYLSDKLQGRFNEYIKNKAISNSVRNGGRGSVDRHNRDIIFEAGRKDYRHHEEGITPTLKNRMGTSGNNVPFVVDVLYKNREPRLNDISPALRQGRAGLSVVSNAITTAVGRIRHSKEELSYIENNALCGQLRRLTPKECFRLQGFLKDEISLEGLSDTQRYKLAGNGWEISIASKILKNMLKEAQ